MRRLSCSTERDIEMGPEIMVSRAREQELMRRLSSKTRKVEYIEKAHESGNREEVEELLKDWLMPGEDTSLAIDYAVRFGHHNLVVDNFATFKAEINILALVSSHTLHKAARAGYDQVVRLLIKFCQQNEPEMLEELITGVDSEFRTPLHWACQNGHTDVAKALVASKVHIIDIPPDDCQDPKFTTPLHLSIKPWETDFRPQLVIPQLQRRSRVELVDLLLQFPEGSELLNVKDWQGNTPLHLAVQTTNVDVIELLIKQPRLVGTERNYEGKTPSRLVWDMIQSDSTRNNPNVKIIQNYLKTLRDVEEENETLRDARSRYYNAANNLLVGGALLAQVTFSGIMSMVTLPHEFLTEVCPTDTLAPSPAGPPLLAASRPCTDTDSHVQHVMKLKPYYVRAIDIFRGSNNLSFYFSIVTIMAAIRLIISRGQNIPLESEISRLRHYTILISLALTFSTIFAVVAFISGGLGNIPVAESGWGYVLTEWARGQSEAILKSTMLTTTMIGLILICPFILLPLIKDYLAILRDYFGRKMVSWDIRHAKHAIGPWRPFLTLLLAILFLGATLFIVFMLIFGVGLLKDYIKLPPTE